MSKIVVYAKILLIMLIVFLTWCHALGGPKTFEELFKLEDTLKLQKPNKDIQAFRIGRDGRIWSPVGPPGKNEVRIYSPKGEVISVIRKEDISPELRTVYFTNIAFDQNYQAYIIDLISGNVAVTDSVGKFLKYFALEYDPDCRAGVGDIEIDKEGNVYLGGPCYQEVDICPESRDFCLHKYNSKGKYIKSFFPFEKKLLELNAGPFEMLHFELDSEGNIWSVHEMSYQIFKYSPKGKLLQEFPGKSSLYKPPTKFSSKSQKAHQAWWNSWTQIENLLVLEPNLILLSLHTHSPSEYVVEIYDQDGNVLATDIQTNHRLLGKDEDGFLYFLLDGKEKKVSREYRIGKFSLNLAEVSKIEKQ